MRYREWSSAYVFNKTALVSEDVWSVSGHRSMIMTFWSSYTPLGSGQKILRYFKFAKQIIETADILSESDIMNM